MRTGRPLYPTLSLSTALAIGALAMTLGAGCASNALEPRALPTESSTKPLPKWYPEAPWSSEAGSSQVYIEGKIVFDTGKDVIRPGSEKVLATLLQFLKEHPEVTRLRVEGHTDDRADEDYNLELSARRSLAVCNWLVDNGVDNLRLIAVGFGKAKPIAPNTIAAGRAENRRTEFHVAEVEGRPFGSKDVTNGGSVLEVLSLAERKAQQEAVVARKAPPPPVTFKPTGDIVIQTSQPAAKGTGGS